MKKKGKRKRNKRKIGRRRKKRTRLDTRPDGQMDGRTKALLELRVRNKKEKEKKIGDEKEDEMKEDVSIAKMVVNEAFRWRSRHSGAIRLTIHLQRCVIVLLIYKSILSITSTLFSDRQRNKEN